MSVWPLHVLLRTLLVLMCLGACARPSAPAAKPAPAPARAPRPAEVDVFALATDEIQARLKGDPTSLGSVSVGRPNGGALFGAVRMPTGEHWELVDEHNAWGTQETIDFLVTAINAAHAHLSKGDKLFVGQLSAETGGRLWPHASHQSGRDVDLGYYYLPGTRGGWYQRAAKVNLDCRRTWGLIRSLIVHSDVEHIFISRSVQRLLKDHALASGEDAAWLNSIFDYKSVHPAPLIRDVMGHTTHMHVRFFNPSAQHLGMHGHNVLAGKTRHRRRLIRPWDKPIPTRRLPPKPASAATATN